MSTISGKITQVLHKNEQDGWICFILRTDDGTEHKVVGHVLGVQEGVVYECSGEVGRHAKFGAQFQAESIIPHIPSTTEGILLYLESGIIAGLGKTYARKIVAQFSDETLAILRDEPQRLLEVAGIGQKRLERIVAGWNQHAAIHEILQYLKQHNIGNADAFRIHRQWGAQAISHINANPFSLTQISGIGFQKADSVAASLGYHGNHSFRVRAGLHYALEKAANNEGHTAVERTKLLLDTAALLGVSRSDSEAALLSELEEGKLIGAESWEGSLIYLPKLFQCESGIVQYIQTLKQGSIAWDPAGFSVKSDIALSPSQRQAVDLVIHSKVSIITGGPGVGKTTIMRVILDFVKDIGANVLLCAPTGRAAKRLAESTGRDAKTIHRLLEYTGESFGRSEYSLLECDLIVIDECSMLDTQLTYTLLKSLPSTTALLLVGDVDQLPSVGPGHVLRDLIDCQQIAVARLTEIFRQAAGSQIIVNSHRINIGQMPLANRSDSDFFFLETQRELIANTIVDLVSSRVPKKYLVETDDIQVLSPVRTRGDCSVNELNKRLQTQLNPARADVNEIRHGNTLFREGDRVMQTRNNYDLDIFNGDIGKITKIDVEEQSICVDFDGQAVELEPEQLFDLDLAYTTTIHKSQGSEYPVVIIPVTYQHYSMLTRNLLYTGVTRGKQLVILVGEKQALHKAVCREQSARISGLRSKLGGPAIPKAERTVVTNADRQQNVRTHSKPSLTRQQQGQQTFDNLRKRLGVNDNADEK